LNFIQPVFNSSVLSFELISGTDVLPFDFSIAAYMKPSAAETRSGSASGHYISNPWPTEQSDKEVPEKYEQNYTNFIDGTISRNKEGRGYLTLYYSLNSDVRN
jgi:hypothetical protein